jgi:dTDP-4-amino-4,6-dideoxy-D-galactose acyltransferase
VAWARANGVTVLYYLASARDPEAAHAAEAAGYRLMDVRVELMRLATEEPSVARVHEAADVGVLRAIAGASHGATRFYADPRFPDERCDSFYETWLVRSCEGWADAVLVAEAEGEAAGFVTCHADRSAARGSIGLIAVHESARGRGIGAELVRGAVDWCARRGLREVAVVTQGRNVAAQRTFESCGFRVESVGLWFHKWLDR